MYVYQQRPQESSPCHACQKLFVFVWHFNLFRSLLDLSNPQETFDIKSYLPSLQAEGYLTGRCLQSKLFTSAFRKFRLHGSSSASSSSDSSLLSCSLASLREISLSQCRSKGNISGGHVSARRASCWGCLGALSPRKFWNLEAWKCYSSVALVDLEVLRVKSGVNTLCRHINCRVIHVAEILLWCRRK